MDDLDKSMTEQNIHSLKSALQTVNNDVIETLEDLLKQAKKGEIASIACVFSMSVNYETKTVWAGMNYNNVAMLGAILVLQHQLVKDCVDF